MIRIKDASAMEKRLKNYLKYMEEISKKTLSEEERVSLREELLVQIGFFQHERLVHLMVTLAFAVLTMAVVIAGLVLASPALLALTLLFLLLLIPYIMHYYLLENETQKMYIQYDKILEHVRQEKQ